MLRRLAALRRRRPSAPTLIALLALFVALGGPAQARRLVHQAVLGKGTVTSREVRDHSLRVRDLSRSTVRRLRRLPNGSVTEAKLRNGAVTPGKLARGAVGTQAIADRGVQAGDIGLGAVGSMEVADGTLSARDVGRYWGRFTVLVGPVSAGACWHGDPVGLAPERAGADISGDVVVVTPGAGWSDTPPSESLTLTAHPSTTQGRFTLTACNPRIVPDPSHPPAAIPAANVSFNYVVIHVP
jgi:hypothetical protein